MAPKTQRYTGVVNVEAELYDFRRPMMLQREYARVLELALGNFVRSWVNQLIGRLRLMVTAEIGDLEMRTYEEYVQRLPPTTCLVTVTLQGGRGRGVLQFPRQTAMAWVDHLLGGQGKFSEAPDRELTEIEVSVLVDFLKHVFRDLNVAFEHVLHLAAEFDEIQYSSQFMQAAEAATPVVFAPVKFVIDDEESDATIMLPVSMIIDAINDGDKHDRRNAEQLAEALMIRNRIIDNLEETPLEVAVRFARRPTNPRELDGLAVGDTLSLRHPTSRPLDVMVGDLIIAEAAAGASGSRLAAMVVNVKKEEFQ